MSQGLGTNKNRRSLKDFFQSFGDVFLVHSKLYPDLPVPIVFGTKLGFVEGVFGDYTFGDLQGRGIKLGHGLNHLVWISYMDSLHSGIN